MAATIEEQIKAIEDELLKTQYNKKTQHHIGRLKAKMARLKIEQEKRRSSSGGGAKGYSIKKSGNATVALVGFPSVGKSTILNKLTDAQSDVGSYDFTTLDVIPGILHHNYAKIQVLDLPGLIRDASKGKGRGREVLSVVRTADLILFVLDIYETNIEVLRRELEVTGIRLDTHPPDVVITKTERGGVNIKPTIRLTAIDEDLARDIVSDFGYVNAEVVIREDITEDELIDALAGNRIYLKSLVVVNKIDLATKEQLRYMEDSLQDYRPLLISAETNVGLDDLKERIFERLDFIRVYMKPQGGEADLDEPMVIQRGSDIGDVCDRVHRSFRRNFRYALVWGESAKFPGQMVGLDHELEDGDIISIVIKRGESATTYE